MRADAARNREIVLAAAVRLFAAAQRVEDVSLSAVAAEAGVGKATVFRSFGDRSGLLRAVFDAHTAAELEALLPLSGDTPADRALEMLTALWAFKSRHGVLTASLEHEGAGGVSPYRAPSYGGWHAALREELVAAWPGSADFLAHALLAAVRSDLVAHLHQMPEDAVRRGLRDLVLALLAPRGARASASRPGEADVVAR